AAAAAPVASSSGAETPVEAPVAGTILRYVRSNGDMVEKDETVLIMESMKMELEVKSKAAGVLTFKADAGSAVAAGQTIAVVC
ncbi:Biotin-requiring enzyme, partial [Formivibrio citricus]